VSVPLKDWPACVAQLHAALRDQPSPLPHAEISVAEWSVGERKGATGCVRFRPDPRPDRSPATHTYPRLRLSRNALVGADLVEQIVADLQERAATFQYAYWERRDRATTRTDLGCPYWELRVNLGDNDRPSSDPALAFGEPPHTDANSAVSLWLEDDGWHAGEWRIQVPDLRARLREVRFTGDGTVHVAADSSFGEDQLEAQVVFGTSHTREVGRARAVVFRDPVALLAPEGADQATVFLVTRANEVLDREQVRREAVEATATEQLELTEQCRRDLAGGEGERVELKPWIVPKDPKEHEVVRTIVAFANTHGGRLYVGVAGTGTPQGRSELFKTFRPDPGRSNGEPTQAAREWLRGLVQEKLRRQPPVVEQVLEVYGEPVLCVVVEAGLDRPYATNDNEIVVRKGASNRRPDPYSELPELLERHAGLFEDLGS
jgi:hypothetical protein